MAIKYGTWNNADVLRFRERLGRLKGGWLVTFNDSPSIRQIFAGCEIQSVERAKGITQAKSKTYREIIITPPAGGR